MPHPFSTDCITIRVPSHGWNTADPKSAPHASVPDTGTQPEAGALCTQKPSSGRPHTLKLCQATAEEPPLGRRGRGAVRGPTWNRVPPALLRSHNLLRTGQEGEGKRELQVPPASALHLEIQDNLITLKTPVFTHKPSLCI